MVTYSMQWALVTGASSGIGRALSLTLAREGYNVALCARRNGLLETLAEEIRTVYNRTTYIIAQDLSQPHAPESITGTLAREGINISFLVNNAGFGDVYLFADAECEKLLSMIQVNITALTELTHRILPGMIERRSGCILNVASVAGFVPGPYMAVYYATKAYVLSFSLALEAEVRKKGIQVTTLCPGPIQSGFAEVAKQGFSGGDSRRDAADSGNAAEKARTNRSIPILDRKSNPDAESLARYAWKAIRKKRGLVVFHAPFRFLIFIQRFLPRSLVTWIMKSLLQYRS